VRALLVVPRLPGTGFTGDRVRTELHLEALRTAGFEVVLVGGAPAGARPALPEGAAEVFPVPLARAALPLALAAAALRGDPLQSALQAGPWARALSQAGDRFELVVWTLVRLWPHVRGRLPGAPVVLDFIDALAAAAEQAAERDPALWRRLYWKLEAPRLARAQRAAAEGARLLLATTAQDAALLPPGTQPLGHGVRLGARPDASPREPLVVFSGRLAYRPNELAARTLLREVWPRVRREVAGARLLLGGADAPPWLRATGGRDGVEVLSPVPDMPALLRRARVAVAPVALGTGFPNKLFEAFEAGTAVVASEEVLQRAAVGTLRPPAASARNPEEMSSAVVKYLRDPEIAAADGAAGRAFVEAHADRSAAVERLAALFRAIGPPC